MRRPEIAGAVSSRRADAAGRGDQTLESFMDGLRAHYPLMPADAHVDVVDFVVR